MSAAGDVPAELGSRIANRMLGGERWARDLLARHAGRTFRVTVGPLAGRFAIGPQGELAAASDEASTLPDLELLISPLRVPAILADPATWSRHVVATGDSALGETLQSLAQTLPWFVERAFASVLGPIAGQRAADAGRALLSFPAYAANRVADSVGSYLRDETDVVVPGVEVRAFGEQVASLSARTDALADRLELLKTAPLAVPRPKAVG